MVKTPNEFDLYFSLKHILIMKKHYLLGAMMIYLSSLLQAQSVGDIAFVGFNADGDDDFALVTLATIPASSIIYFTDNEPDDITGNEGYLTWNTGASPINAGTIVVFSDIGDEATFTVSTGSLTGSAIEPINFNGGGDALFAFLGTNETTPTTYLAGIQNESGNEGSVTGLTGTGLTAGTTFVTYTDSGHPDGGSYSGNRNTESSFSDYLALIGDPSNWTVEVGDGELILPFPTDAFSIATGSLVGFDQASSEVFETNATFEVLIPITLSNYGGSQVDISVAVTGGTAEGGDYILNTSSLSYTANGTQNISIDINDDVDDELETIELTITETSATGVLISPSTHTIAVNDDDTVPLVISEILYRPNGDEYLEIYNAGTATVNIENYYLEGVDIVFTSGDEITADTYIVIASDASVYSGNGYDVYEFTSGGLDNTGETLILRNSSGAIVDQVTYTNELDATNDGFSLSLGNTDEDNSNMDFWVGSTLSGGTPGTANDVTVWTAAIDNDWSNGGNWSNGLPSSSLSVIVPSGITSPIIADDTQMGSLKTAASTLTISSGTTSVDNELILSGDATVSSGATLAILNAATGSGELTVSRNTTGNEGYSILGSPVQDMLLDDLSADYLYTYDESTSTYVEPTGTMTSAEGFFVGYDASSPSVSFTGTPNSGNHSAAVTANDQGFNLVANPYAAAISMEDFRTINGTTVIDGVIYLWDDGGSNIGANRGGDFVTVSALGVTSISDLGDGVAGGQGTTAAETGYITSTQGFFVRATASGDVDFTPEMQVTTTGANVDANHYRESTTNPALIRLSLSGMDQYNEILIGLTELATPALDPGLDAMKLSVNEHISFYSFIDNDKFAIQALPLVESDAHEIQLGFDLSDQGTYSVKVNSITNLEDHLTVKLVDQLTGKKYDLQSVSSVSFESAITSTDKRFKLIIESARVLSKEDLSTGLKVFGTTSELTIQSNLRGLKEVSIYSLDGRIAFRQSVNFINNEATIHPHLTQNNIYIMNIDEQKFKFIIK